MAEFETITYEEDDGVAWVTLNRPEVMNAFNHKMEDELQFVWREIRGNDDVRVVVLTGAGERAFCTGIDRDESINPEIQGAALAAGKRVGFPTPWTYDDPGEKLCPKQRSPRSLPKKRRPRPKKRRSRKRQKNPPMPPKSLRANRRTKNQPKANPKKARVAPLRRG